MPNQDTRDKREHSRRPTLRYAGPVDVFDRFGDGARQRWRRFGIVRASLHRRAAIGRSKVGAGTHHGFLGFDLGRQRERRIFHRDDLYIPRRWPLSAAAAGPAANAAGSVRGAPYEANEFQAWSKVTTLPPTLVA